MTGTIQRKDELFTVYRNYAEETSTTVTCKHGKQPVIVATSNNQSPFFGLLTPKGCVGFPSTSQITYGSDGLTVTFTHTNWMGRIMFISGEPFTVTAS